MSATNFPFLSLIMLVYVSHPYYPQPSHGPLYRLSFFHYINRAFYVSSSYSSLALFIVSISEGKTYPQTNSCKLVVNLYHRERERQIEIAKERERGREIEGVCDIFYWED